MSLSGVPYWLFLLGLFLAVGSPGAAAGTDELNSAFLAVFGKSAPVERHVKQQAPGATDAQENDVDLSLTPQFLVTLKDGRYALVVNETTRSTRAGGASNNAVSIAYLSHADGAWAVEHVWLEVGGLGVAGNAGSEVKTFGADPIYFSIEEWCGFNSCSDSMEVLVLETAGPRVLGEIKGGAIYPVEFPDAGPDCETYNYTARVSSPSSSAGRFSITYEGWTAPYRKLLPKHRFRRTADVVEKGGTLVTGLQTPDCMR